MILPSSHCLGGCNQQVGTKLLPLLLLSALVSLPLGGMEISNVPSGDEWWHWAFVVLMRVLCVSKKECIKFQAPLVPQYPTKILS